MAQLFNGLSLFDFGPKLCSLRGDLESWATSLIQLIPMEKTCSERSQIKMTKGFFQGSIIKLKLNFQG